MVLSTLFGLYLIQYTGVVLDGVHTQAILGTNFLRCHLVDTSWSFYHILFSAIMLVSLVLVLWYLMLSRLSLVERVYFCNYFAWN